MSPGTGDRLQRLWWLHDALWYQGVAKRFGFKVANEINLEAIRPVAKRAMKAVLADLDRKGKRDLSAKGVIACFREASALMWPPPMTAWEAKIVDGKIVEVMVTRCYAIEGIKRIGAAEAYECPCIAVREGWLQALRLKARQEVLTSMREGAGVCLIRVRFEDDQPVEVQEGDDHQCSRASSSPLERPWRRH